MNQRFRVDLRGRISLGADCFSTFRRSEPAGSLDRVINRKGPFNRSENGMSTNGRKSNGRFGKGNKGGPDRPARDIEADYLPTLSDTVTSDRWRRIVARAADDAEAGDHRAREWLGKYLVGDKAAVAISMHTETPMRVVELDDWYGNADRLEDSA